MFEKVFFPIDLSEVSITCARAMRELRKYGANEIKIFHALEYEPDSLVEGGVDVEKFISKLKSKIEEKLYEISEELSRDFSVSFEVFPTVNPVTEILKRSENYDLMLIPSRSKSSLLVGKTAEKVIRNVKIPCLVIKARENAGRSYYEQILRNIFEKPVLILEQLKFDPKVVERFLNFGTKEIKLIHVADLDNVLEEKVSKEEIIHPLVPIPKLAEILSDYWKRAREELEKFRHYFTIKGVNASVYVGFGSIEKCLEVLSKSEGFSVAFCEKQNFEKVLKVSDAVFVGSL
ncbi:MAG: universal stress protein [Archaeoglobaceae archaeon]